MRAVQGFGAFLQDLAASHDWRVLAVVLCVAVVLVRMGTFWPVRTVLGALDRKVARTVTRRYQERSAPGWAFIAGSAILAEWVWVAPSTLPGGLDARGWGVAALLLFVLGMAAHLHAYLTALVTVLTVARGEEPESA